MVKHRIPFQNLKSIARVALVGLGLNGAMYPLGQFVCVIEREGARLLSPVVLIAWRASLTCGFDYNRLLESALRMLLLFWPPVLTIVRMVQTWCF